MSSVKSLRNRFYGLDYVSPFNHFNQEAIKITEENSYILHAGCGADSSIGFTTKAKVTIGIDENEWIRRNTDLDYAVIGNLTNLPFKHGSLDLIAARWVMEHLEKPDIFLSESFRVLAPSGHLIILTPNLLNYAVLITKFSPHWFQRWFVKNILHLNPEEVFYTYYRINSPRRIRKLVSKAGLQIEYMELIEGRPDLLAFSPFTFILGVLCQRILTNIKLFSNFRGTIFAIIKKV